MKRIPNRVGAWRRTVGCLAVLGCMAASVQARPAVAVQIPPTHVAIPPTHGTIPATHGTTLGGDAIDLPQALGGKAGVLVLGFTQAARDAVTQWGKRLAADYRGSPEVLYFEMPMLADVPRLLRGMVLRSMKSSVPERAQARFLPLTENEAEWRALVHASKETDGSAYVLVVDSAGKVHWQTAGPATDATYAALKVQVEALRAGGLSGGLSGARAGAMSGARP